LQLTLHETIHDSQVTRKIKDAISLSEISTGVKDIGRKVEDIHDRIMNQPAVVANTLPSLLMPQKPRIFYGRDRVVEDIAQCLTQRKSPRIAILGPGGMGKTSVALAVMEQAAVEEKFGKNCFWVPCVEATSPSRLLDLIASSLRAPQSTNDRLNDIISELGTSSHSRVLLLDNFETPWDLPGQQPEIESILRALANVPHLALLLTMRSDQPPSEQIEWESQHLSSLNGDVASKIYTRIHPEASSDPSLSQLLVELGGMPLAITLMARLGKNSGDKPGILLENWNKDSSIDLLDDGLDSKTSISISIRLSLDSHLMKNNPNAITLLSILSMLPGGAQRSFLTKMAPSFNVPRALACLSQSSLSDQRRSTNSIHVQPVIRRYVQRHHPLPSDMRRDVYKAFCQFVKDHTSEPGNPKFETDAEALANEEANIQAVLLEAAQQDNNDAVMEALLAFSWYQHWVRPRVELVEHTVRIARGMDDTHRIAEALRCQACIYLELDRYDDACTAISEAKGIFESLNDKSREADCILRLGEIHRWQNHAEKCLRMLTEAQEKFQELGNDRGIAESLLNLGALHWKCGRFPDAFAALTKAKEDFQRVPCPLGAAHCLLYLSKVRLNQRRYELAYEAAEEARSEYQRLHYTEGVAVCLTILGMIEVISSRYSDASTTFEKSLSEYQRLGGPLGIAQSLHALGLIFRRQSQHDHAISFLHTSRQRHQLIDSHLGRAGAAECLEGLGNAYYAQSCHDTACDMFEEAYREYQHLGLTSSAARCQRRLLEIRAEESVKESSTEATVKSLKDPFVGHLL
jgi:tetratricopeptide (TPR) repeat protein